MSSPREIPNRLNRALEDRYAVEREIGQGGMATVYLAKDLTHHRDVAIKVLSPEVAHALGSERFLNEIEIAANLTHPNILPLFDSGQADGLLYYVMPYVEGDSLRGHLTRERRLPLEEVILIVGEVADALSYAHDRKLVHRDVKPENILFTAGHAVVADFGIAKALDAAGGEHLTRTGITVGTPAYMSPEQAGGSEGLDGRSDQYSLGCLAYEMLGGQPPFIAPTPQAVLARHAVDPVPELRTIRPDIPGGVARAIHKALAKVPADRFASARAFSDALRKANTEEARSAEAAKKQREAGRRRMGRAGAGIIMVALAVWVGTLFTGPTYERLAVLPPTNLLNDPEQEHLIQGVYDQLIGELQKAGLTVKARRSMMRYRDGDAPVREIAREVGVDAFIEPSIRWVGDSIEINLRLVDGSTEEYIGNPIVEHVAVRNVIDLYRNLVRQVVDGLRLSLSPEAEARLASAGPVDPEAYEDYLNGRFHWGNLTPASLEAALGYYESALEKQPDFAQAHAGIAHVWAGRMQMGYTPPFEAGPKAREALARALAIDSTAFEVQYVAGAVRVWWDLDWEGGESSFRRAIDINPGYAEVRAHYAHLLMMLGRMDEAEGQMQRAMELDPLNPLVQSFHAQVLIVGGHLDEAIAFCEDALGTAPDNPVAIMGLMTSYHLKGMSEEALEYAGQILAIAGQPDLSEVLQTVYAEEGAPAAWRFAAESASALPHVLPLMVGVLFDYAGDTDEAVSWIQRAVELRDPNAPYLASEPLSSELRNDPRFKELLRRMNLPVF